MNTENLDRRLLEELKVQYKGKLRFPVLTCRPHEFKLLRDTLTDRDSYAQVRADMCSFDVAIIIFRIDLQSYTEYLEETLGNLSVVEDSI